jgi:hypothetical protein
VQQLSAGAGYIFCVEKIHHLEKNRHTGCTNSCETWIWGVGEVQEVEVVRPTVSGTATTLFPLPFFEQKAQIH